MMDSFSISTIWIITPQIGNGKTDREKKKDWIIPSILKYDSLKNI